VTRKDVWLVKKKPVSVIPRVGGGGLEGEVADPGSPGKVAIERR